MGHHAFGRWALRVGHWAFMGFGYWALGIGALGHWALGLGKWALGVGHRAVDEQRELLLLVADGGGGRDGEVAVRDGLGRASEGGRLAVASLPLHHLPAV